MTKASYFEMCEALGNEPEPSEIPVEYSDLPNEIQFIFSIYGKLRDDFDTVNGIYLGKSRAGLIELLDLMEVPVADRLFTLDVIDIIDTHRGAMIKQSLDAKKAATT